MDKWKFSTSLIMPITVLVAGGIVFLVFFNPLERRRQNQRGKSCQSNLKQVALAMAQYTQDFGGKFPLKKVGGSSAAGWRIGTYSGLPVGWADALQPQLKSESLYHCPNAPNRPQKSSAKYQGTASQPGYTDYWFNSNLSGAVKSSVAFPGTTFLVGEGNDRKDITDATYSKSHLPTSWLTDQSSPAFRHLGGANYLFVDGHVARLKPDKVTNCYGRSDCFALK